MLTLQDYTDRKLKTASQAELETLLSLLTSLENRLENARAQLVKPEMAELLSLYKRAMYLVHVGQPRLSHFPLAAVTTRMSADQCAYVTTSCKSWKQTGVSLLGHLGKVCSWKVTAHSFLDRSEE